MPSGRLWKCDICGTVAPWDDNWQHWGSIATFEDWGRHGIVVTCSTTCRNNAKPAQILRQRGVKI